MTRRVLILGAGGFTGTHLAALLRREGRWDPLDGRAFGADLRRTDTLAPALAAARADAVINLAALSSVTEGDVRGLYDVNAFGWMALLQALRQTGFGGRVIFASTANVYGERTSGLITEDRVPDPANHYGLSKHLAERLTLLEGAGLDVVTTRPFNCIGVGQKPQFLVPKLVRHFRERAARIELGNLDVERDFVDIRDAACAYALLLDAPAPPDLLHIASGRAVSIRALIALLEGITVHRMEVVVNPAFIRANELRHQQGDPSRLAGLGFVPQFSLEDTLRWMLAGAS